jgi:LacI family transcriptional regulator
MTSSGKQTESQRVTMRDVARLAGGVHQSTVSLALRNHPAISLATRQRIQNAATEAGYCRDPLLDAFNTRRASAVEHRWFPVIAFVEDFASAREMDASPIHAALWRGVSKAAESLYHRVELFLVGPNGMAPGRLDSMLYARSIDCLVAAVSGADVPQLQISWDRYCAVKVDCLNWPTPHFTIAADILQGTRLAVRKARDLGYSRIGLVIDEQRMVRNDLLRAGYLIEQTPAPGARRLKPLTIRADLNAGIIRDWIRSHRIDAVLSDTPDFGALLSSVGFVPGRDVGWACLNLPSTDTTIAGIVSDYERIGTLAVEQVVSLSRMNQHGASSSAMVTYVPVVWRDAASLPDRRKSRA